MEVLHEFDNILEKCDGEKQAPCKAACPTHVNVPGFIKLIREGKMKEALDVFRESNPFPAICGRVCHHPCEGECSRGSFDDSVAIKYLHRYLADCQVQPVQEKVFQLKKPKQDKVAVIGSGPAGLSCAYFLKKEGYQVVIYEKLSTVGGMLSIGIPEFRLPKEIVQREIQIIKDMGVKFLTGISVGTDITIEELRKEGYKSFFLGIGSQECVRLGIQGENLTGVYPGLDYLREANLGKAPPLGSRIAVIGGGNVALDTVRMAKRLEADQAFVIYRRGLNEMPANEEEIRECQEEGIRIETLSHPIRILGENGKVSAIECVRMELGEKDADGRRQPIPVNGSEFIIEVDGVMPAIGQESEWSCLSPGCTCNLTEWGTMHIDSYTLQTDEPDIFAGGDAVTGPKTVVEAIEAGKQAAMSIDRYIQGVDLQAGRKLNRSANKETYWKETYWEDGIPHQPRTAMPKISPEERVDNFIEVETGYNTENAICEAGRCLQCECRICVKNCEFLAKNCTSPYELALKMKAGQFREHPETVYSCNLCGLCCQLCPNDLDIGTLCLQLREQLVEEGLGPLRGHAFVRKNQDYVLSESFSLVLPDKKSGRCEHVFFPGCNLPGYSPSLTLSTYKYLQEKQPDTGIVLGCCGVQTLHLGDRKKFKEIFGKTVDILKKTGAKEVIVACPECYETFKKNAPEINLTFISETLINVGLPDGVMGQGQTFSLHDSCATRDESELQENIRVLVRQLGYQIEEMKYSRAETSCCGLGGQAAFVDRKLVKTIVKNRIEQATHDLLTYCASCREAFADEKDTIHVLDLVFNSDWENDKSKPTNTGKTRRENQARFKKMLE